MMSPAREHAQRVARSLYGKVALLKVVELPDLPKRATCRTGWRMVARERRFMTL